jgi:CheY-like chemotaxis protein
MHPLAVEKGIELRTRYLTQIPERIETDPLRVRQILLNLMSNAIKFTPQGHVDLAVSCRQKEAGLLMELAIEDTGIGIPAERINTIFEAFAQGPNPVPLKAHGTGLGLTICQRLVALLGGEIRVSSMVGQGSRFVVELPVGRYDASQMKEVEDVTRTAALRDSHMVLDVFIPCRVLIAEDTRAIQFMMSRMLQDVVTGIAVADNGQAAIEAVEQAAKSDTPFDIVLMDMQMPLMNGFDATAELRKKGYTLPIIALTAGAMAGDREKCLAAGCTDYLPKPIDRLELLAKLELHCGT